MSFLLEGENDAGWETKDGFGMEHNKLLEHEFMCANKVGILIQMLIRLISRNFMAGHNSLGVFMADNSICLCNF